MPEITDQQLRDLILRLPSLPEGLPGRVAQAEALIRAALKDPEPDTRRARNVALAFLQAELTQRRKAGLIGAALIEVQLAGTTLGVGIGVHNWMPDRPPGPWPPAGVQYAAVFTRNLIQTLEGDQQ